MDITAMPDDISGELREALESERPSGHADLTPGTKSQCPGCGKSLTVTSKGVLRAHKCDSVGVTTTLDGLPDDTSPALVKAVRVARSKRGRKVPVPPVVRKWGVAGLGYAAETGAEYYVASLTGLDRNQIPDSVTALPNPDAMCGPMVDAVWPALPPKVQAQIAKVLEHEALIEACTHWYLYARTLNAFAVAYHEKFPNQPAKNRSETHVAVAASTQARSGTPAGSPAFADGLKAGRDR